MKTFTIMADGVTGEGVMFSPGFIVVMWDPTKVDYPVIAFVDLTSLHKEVPAEWITWREE